MQTNNLSTVVDGEYFWELIFSYDNKHNTETITEKYKITRKKTINYKEFISRKFNIKTVFQYKNSSSVSLKFEGVVTGSTNADFTYHIEMANELQQTTEITQTIDEETIIERVYNIGAKSRLDLYRLCYLSDGILLKTDTVATEPKKNVLVKLEFSCITHIFGLSEILNLFSHTEPSQSNKEEWKNIRDNIIRYSDRTEEEAFRRFVEILNTINPGRDNKIEWEAIRSTCGEILSAWEQRDKQSLFIKLLKRFSVTSPTIHNKVEWKNIRDLSNQILSGLRQVY